MSSRLFLAVVIYFSLEDRPIGGAGELGICANHVTVFLVNLINWRVTEHCHEDRTELYLKNLEEDANLMTAEIMVNK